jgi:hypothetical protein
MVMRGVIWASLLLVSLPDRGEGGGWYTHRPKLTLDYLHGPLADSLSRYRGLEQGIYTERTTKKMVYESKQVREMRRLRREEEKEKRGRAGGKGECRKTRKVLEARRGRIASSRESKKS